MTRGYLRVLLFICLCSSSFSITSTASKEVVTFDFGWKFRLGLHEPPTPSKPPVEATCITRTGIALNNTKYADGNGPRTAANAEDCCNQCTNQPNCQFWSFQVDETQYPNVTQCAWAHLTYCCYYHTSNDTAVAQPAGEKWTSGGYDSGPGNNPAEVQPLYNDSDWTVVNAPHDGLVLQGASNTSCPDGCSGRSYIPRPPMWYRKHFYLPEDWVVDKDSNTSSIVQIEFDGVFHATIVYLNGKIIARNDEGYLGFVVPLSNSTGTLRRGNGNPNILALFIDTNGGAGFSNVSRSGWWYEGGGIYRHTRIVRLPTSVYFATDGVVARSDMLWDGDTPTASLTVQATIMNAGTISATGMSIMFTLIDKNSGERVHSKNISVVSISARGNVTATVTITIASPKLWSAKSPNLYDIEAVLASPNLSLLDNVSIPHGFRSIKFSGVDGQPSCTINKHPFKWRGFCDHDNFAVVGMAVPDRIKLFRAQMGRAAGGNARRTSHNPPDPVMLSIYDALGTVVMEETRKFDAEASSVNAMAAMVRRDRNHPSVAMWSFCNEAECEQPINNPSAPNPQLGAPLFASVVKQEDGTRPTAANTPGWHGAYPPWIPTDKLTQVIDIQGFSHASAAGGNGKEDSMQVFHRMPAYATKPIFGSECCSCNTMRDEDTGCESSDGHDFCIQKSFAADCSQAQVAPYNNPAFVIGTMIWTLFDYIGEPTSGWPNVISSFGQFDVAGFPKAQAYWYRDQWLLRSNDSEADKTFSTGRNSSVHLVESWEQPKNGSKRNITVYSAANEVELFINGESLGTQKLPPQEHTENATIVQSWAEWDDIVWQAGNITAVARDQSGAVVAVDTRLTCGDAKSIKLSIDSPSPTTGTGKAIFADGQDMALVRATIVDSTGQTVHDAAHLITFTIVTGSGKLVGTHNGRQDSHMPANTPTVAAYHGLARSVIVTTSVAGLPASERDLLSQIDVNNQHLVGFDGFEADDIVVSASSPGLGSAQIIIPLSTDPSDKVMSVARAMAGTSVTF
eukprot:m.344703 g.344703  ORF g.344703 m.344703 type:complete len:1020 (-) comp24995_c0_seq1:110-3169(-)